ncbi:MAG TPA: hypothetical protein VFI48_02175, partial [Hyphomicrobiaceae bacterium]|nr:hypothetical protein [Hyphomicrobiaceae bacterium]
RPRRGCVGVNLALLRQAHAQGHKMTSGWHFQDDATPTPGEVEAMVAVLEGRHGVLAAEVAEFFSTLHSLKGDAGRSWAWAGVAELVRRRVAARLAEPSP